MGTRADFYVGRGPQAVWLGSTAWDGYPDGITPKGEKKVIEGIGTIDTQGVWPGGRSVLHAETEAEFRELLEVYFAGRNDVTRPDRGWPWPWRDSHLTDYAYAFDDGQVWHTTFPVDDERVTCPTCGHGTKVWWPASKDVEDPTPNGLAQATFPDMKAVTDVAFDDRSGLMVFTVKK